MSDWIALIATICGFAIAAGGLYLTYRARAITFQQAVHARQLDFIERLTTTIYSCWWSCAKAEHATADDFDEMEKTTREIQGQMIRATPLLPKSTTEALGEFASGVVDVISPNAMVAKEHYDIRFERFKIAYWHLIEVLREDLGVDALSDSAKKIFGDAVLR